MNVKGVHCTKYFHNASKSVYRFRTKSVPTKWNVFINKISHECKGCTLYKILSQRIKICVSFQDKERSHEMERIYKYNIA